jgi:hypothetical protein
MPQVAKRYIFVSRAARAGHSTVDVEDKSIANRACVLAVALTGLLGAAGLTGCSGDQSLGRGLRVSEVANDPDASAASGLTDAAGAEAGSACVSSTAGDAGGGLASGLVAWYRCEAATGASSTLLPDSTANGHDATLVTGTGATSGYAFATGKVGDALDLDYTKQGYATLPPGLLADACEATIATWVYINSNVNAWTRIWDFGQDTTTYMFLTPITNLDNVARFGISTQGNQQEQNLKATAAVPTLRWTHVALVLGAGGATLYFDGEAVGTNPAIALRPADLGPTLNNYIGRSQFSDDPFLDGDIDEFRVYDRALSSEEIKALANAY